MGWTKVCGTALSGIWVLKGNARTRMLPANLDHLRVGWRKQGTYETARVTPGHDCLSPSKHGHGTACIRWHSDDEPLFGPPNQPKLIVSMSLGHSVEFQVRRASCDVPFSITLDHGDLLVMDGLTQSEYVHCTASGLQGPRVNITYRWVAQHIASCPLAGVVGCVLPTCAQGLAEPSSRWLGEGENKWSSSWGLVLLLSILVFFLLINTWIHTRERHRHSCRRPSHLKCALPLSGSCPLGWGTALATVTTLPISQESVFVFPLSIFLVEKTSSL